MASTAASAARPWAGGGLGRAVAASPGDVAPGVGAPRAVGAAIAHGMAAALVHPAPVIQVATAIVPPSWCQPPALPSPSIIPPDARDRSQQNQ